MSPVLAVAPGPGVMASPSRSIRGLMEFHPNAAPLELSRDGVKFLWLLALVLAFVLSLVLLGNGIGHR